jgi:general secretion pathway protein K
MIPVPLSDHRRRVAQRGSALIMVIFLITVLYMIVHAMHEIVTKDVNLAIAQQQAFRARQVAEMGLNWAMNPAVKEYDRDILDQTLEDGSTFSAKIRGEGGRLNINAILQQGQQGTESQARGFLTKLFALWLGAGERGVNEKADLLFDMMVDWIDAGDDAHMNGYEKDDYVSLYGENTPYPFNRPFYSLEEMLLVPGFDEVVANVPDWRDYFTIYSAGKLDINAAEAKVLAATALAALGRSDPARDWEEKLMDAMELVQDRWGPDGIEDTEDDIKMQSAEEMNAALMKLGLDPSEPGVTALFGLNDQTTHIECVATVGDYRKRVVLIVRGRTGQPQILSREEVPLFQ